MVNQCIKSIVLQLCRSATCSSLLSSPANVCLNSRVCGSVFAWWVAHWQQWLCVTADDDDDDGLWVNPWKSLDPRLPLRGISERISKGGGQRINHSNVRTASPTLSGHSAVVEAWKESCVSGGHEIVTLHSRGSRETLPLHYFGEIGKQGYRVPSIHPSIRLQSLRLPHSGSLGILQVPPLPPPSCLVLKARFHPDQLAELLSSRLKKWSTTDYARIMWTVCRCQKILSLHCVRNKWCLQGDQADSRTCSHAK